MIGARRGRDTAISFNGEIYNFKALRAERLANDEIFDGRSDSEVLLRGLDSEGPAFLQRADGMYGLGYWDGEQLLLARDRFGEKPLYYRLSKGWIAFASELSALHATPDFDDRISVDKIALYCAFHCIPSPYSIYDAISKVPPGASITLSFRNGKVHADTRQTRRFLHAPEPPLALPTPLAERAEGLEALLADAVASRMTGDAPLGVFLSAGVDSAIVAALMARRLDYPACAYSIGLESHPDSEHFAAHDLASLLGLTHQTRMIKAADVAMLERLAADFDEPNGDSSCVLTALLSETVAERGKVVLSGDGADELFAGYSRYQRVDDGVSPGRAYLDDFLVFHGPELERLFGRVPSVCAERIDAIRSLIDTPGDPLVRRLRRVDADEYLCGPVLAKVDRASMRSGVEVRAPFLAPAVTAFAESLTEEECLGRGGKALLKAVADRILPPGWCDRPKRGFGVPMDRWARTYLDQAARTLLLSENCRLAEWIQPERLRSTLSNGATPLSSPRLWTIFALEAWLRAHPGRCA